MLKHTNPNAEGANVRWIPSNLGLIQRSLDLRSTEAITLTGSSAPSSTSGGSARSLKKEVSYKSSDLGEIGEVKSVAGIARVTVIVCFSAARVYQFDLCSEHKSELYTGSARS